jgi:hypothetical protein
MKRKWWLFLGSTVIGLIAGLFGLYHLSVAQAGNSYYISPSLYYPQSSSTVYYTDYTTPPPAYPLFNSSSLQPSQESWSISPQQSQFNPGSMVTVSTTGNRAVHSIGIYMMKRTDANANLPTNQSCTSDATCYDSQNITQYSVNSSMNTDSWYSLGRCDSNQCALQIQLPPDHNVRYYFAANFHTDPNWWSSNDTVCAWEGWLAKSLNGQTPQWITDSNHDTYSCTNHAFPDTPGMVMY